MKFFTKFGFDVQSFSAATFFCTYELTKNVLKPRTSSTMFPFVHMCAATLGEVVSYHQPFNSQDLISNSPYCLLYSPCNVSLKNLVLDQLIIP